MHPARKFSFDDLYTGLQYAKQEGLVYEQKKDNLRLYCYSEETVYERKWMELTVIARGIILDIEEKKIIATPFPKFFNHGEVYTNIPDLPFEIYEKLDGSLIIIYHYAGKWRCATKGSLNSDQAQWAGAWIEKCGELHRLTPGTTYLAEAIYPSNRIVIDYGVREGLWLLGAYREDGTEFDYAELHALANDLEWGIAARYQYGSISELLEKAKEIDCNSEGWVLKFSDTTRIKIKGDEYCRVHRLVSGLTPLSVWRAMAEGGIVALDKIRKDLPEEFWQDFDTMHDLLENQLSDILEEVAGVDARTSEWTDKEVGIALETFTDPVRRIIFSWRKNNGDPLSDSRSKRLIFEMIRPDRNVLPGYRASSSVKRVQENE